jgi:hypothetical protein
MHHEWTGQSPFRKTAEKIGEVPPECCRKTSRTCIPNRKDRLRETREFLASSPSRPCINIGKLF